MAGPKPGEYSAEYDAVWNGNRWVGRYELTLQNSNLYANNQQNALQQASLYSQQAAYQQAALVNSYATYVPQPLPLPEPPEDNLTLLLLGD